MVDHSSKDTLQSDLAVMGIPCPLFSRLNQKTRGTGKGWNPFLQRLGKHGMQTQTGNGAA